MFNGSDTETVFMELCAGKPFAVHILCELFMVNQLLITA